MRRLARSSGIWRPARRPAAPAPNVTAFARAISGKPLDLPLDATSRGGPRAPLADRSFTVVSASGVLAVDCDNAAEAAATHERLEALEYLRSALEAAGGTSALEDPAWGRRGLQATRNRAT